jgi:hypothetical protein
MKNNAQHHSPKQPRPLVLALILTSMIAFEAHPTLTNNAGAVSNPFEFKNKIALIKGELIGQNQVENLPNGLPQKVADAVFQDISKKQGISPKKLRILEAKKRTWPNGCLGLAEKDVFCTEVIVSGWQLTVTNQHQSQAHWVYRTNNSGTVVKLEK